MHPADYRALRKELQALYGTPRRRRARSLELAAFHVAMMLAGGGAVLRGFGRGRGLMAGLRGGAVVVARLPGHLDQQRTPPRTTRCFAAAVANQASWSTIGLPVPADGVGDLLVPQAPRRPSPGPERDRARRGHQPRAGVRVRGRTSPRRPGWWRRLLLRWQGLVFPVALAFNGLQRAAPGRRVPGPQAGIVGAASCRHWRRPRADAAAPRGVLCAADGGLAGGARCSAVPSAADRCCSAICDVRGARGGALPGGGGGGRPEPAGEVGLCAAADGDDGRTSRPGRSGGCCAPGSTTRSSITCSPSSRAHALPAKMAPRVEAFCKRARLSVPHADVVGRGGVEVADGDGEAAAGGAQRGGAPDRGDGTGDGAGRVVVRMRRT
jgi:hypothetical protein